MDFSLVVMAVIALFVVYKLGLFGPIIGLTNVAVRESAIYDREHKVKVAKRYLSGDNEFSADDIAKINSNIAAIDELKFD